MMKEEILRTLDLAGGCVSGQELCRRLNVSRTAIWKSIHQLKEEGYEIESVPRKGYRILARPDLITDTAVGSRLETEWAARSIAFFPTVDSTNNEAKRMAEQGAPEGTLVIAEEQNQGRGRRGRTWMTPAGSAVAMSLILRPSFAPATASMVTLVMGLAVATACREFCGVEARIKWPNDIVAEGRKICGILTEMSSEVDCINYVVVGIGINTNIADFPQELRQVAVSLHEIMGRRPDRAGLIAACMKRFEEYYAVFMRDGSLASLMEEYNRLLVSRDACVRVLEPGNEYSGISEGINAGGELQVRREDGTVSSVFAGEVSVRGVYGYV